MAKFSKYNNPNKKRNRKSSSYSSAYIAEKRKEMYCLLAKAETEEERNYIIKAYDVTIRPY